MKLAPLLIFNTRFKLRGALLPCCYGATTRSTGRYSDLPMQQPHSLPGPPPAAAGGFPLVSSPGEPLLLPTVSAAAP